MVIVTADVKNSSSSSLDDISSVVRLKGAVDEISLNLEYYTFNAILYLSIDWSLHFPLDILLFPLSGPNYSNSIIYIVIYVSV